MCICLIVHAHVLAYVCVHNSTSNEEVWPPFGTIMRSLLSRIPQELSAVIDKHERSGNE